MTAHPHDEPREQLADLASSSIRTLRAARAPQRRHLLPVRCDGLTRLRTMAPAVHELPEERYHPSR
jgi:hypothetical protein